jgi:hypothetical protein
LACAGAGSRTARRTWSTNALPIALAE